MSHMFFPDFGSPNRPSQLVARRDAAKATHQGGLTWGQTWRAARLLLPHFCGKCCALVLEGPRSQEAKGSLHLGNTLGGSGVGRGCGSSPAGRPAPCQPLLRGGNGGLTWVAKTSQGKLKVEIFGQDHGLFKHRQQIKCFSILVQARMRK